MSRCHEPERPRPPPWLGVANPSASSPKRRLRCAACGDAASTISERELQLTELLGRKSNECIELRAQVVALERALMTAATSFDVELERLGNHFEQALFEVATYAQGESSARGQALSRRPVSFRQTVDTSECEVGEPLVTAGLNDEDGQLQVWLDNTSAVPCCLKTPLCRSHSSSPCRSPRRPLGHLGIDPESDVFVSPESTDTDEFARLDDSLDFLYEY